MTLVRKVDGEWLPVEGVQTLERMVATCTITYHDGRQVEAPCDPYPVMETLDMGKVRQFVADGLWGAMELKAYGLRNVTDQGVPEGKQRVGEPRYVERKGEIIEEWELIAFQAPVELTPAEKLASVGLTATDLRSLLGAE